MSNSKILPTRRHKPQPVLLKTSPDDKVKPLSNLQIESTLGPFNVCVEVSLPHADIGQVSVSVKLDVVFFNPILWNFPPDIDKYLLFTLQLFQIF